jgi:hypothetical protein
MCFPNSSHIINVEKYNWAGDLIVNTPVLLSFRKVPKTNKRYKIDVRDFIKAKGNALIDIELSKIRDFADKIKAYRKHREAAASSKFFLSKKMGAFDFRVDVIMAAMADKFVYSKSNKEDPWLMPEETLRNNEGDCEDFAFLLASLLISSGISSYNIRVALGKVKITYSDSFTDEPKGHAWVMYKQEDGKWKVLEPTLMAGKVKKNKSEIKIEDIPTKPAKDVAAMEYIPQFVFNGDHLWVVKEDKKDQPDLMEVKSNFEDDINKRWNNLDVSFNGEIHQYIIKKAIDGLPQFGELAKGFKKAFIFFGPVLDRIDNFLSIPYDPIEHFDNGYIDEGWVQVTKNIDKFKANRKDFLPLCKAVHAVADFYAHTTYVHFAQVDATGKLPICDFPNLQTLTNNSIDYETDASFAGKWGVGNGQFSENALALNSNPRIDVVKTWKGKIISGRYAQVGDHKDPIEGLCPVPKIFDSDPLFFTRGAMPHHDEIAVDSGTIEKLHLLYNDNNPDDPKSYSNQFKIRRDLAIEHITGILKTI